MAERGPEYGDLAERNARLAAKFDSAQAKSIFTWINETAGTNLSGDFQEALKDGIALCELINALAPGSVKGISKLAAPFKQMENISKFLQALPAYGVRSNDLFQTAALYEGTNLAQVLSTLESVRRIAEQKASGVAVPSQAVASSPFQKTEKVDKWLPKKKTEKERPLAEFNQYTASEGAGKESNAYGDLAERMARLDAKYDKSLEASLRTWIESQSGGTIGDDFQAGLKDGVLLCKAANANGANIKVNTGSLAFKQMENIENFLKACDAKGLVSSDKFQVVDLFEGSNMPQVLTCINAFQRKC